MRANVYKERSRSPKHLTRALTVQDRLFGVLLDKPAVPTGYLEAQSLKRTRGFLDPHPKW